MDEKTLKSVEREVLTETLTQVAREKKHLFVILKKSDFDALVKSNTDLDIKVKRYRPKSVEVNLTVKEYENTSN